jgi:hypothetical protein
MKIELNFYKNTGKWYTKEVIENVDIDLIQYYVVDNNLYPNMDYTVHIVENGGFLQPYKMFRR